MVRHRGEGRPSCPTSSLMNKPGPPNSTDDNTQPTLPLAVFCKFCPLPPHPGGCSVFPVQTAMEIGMPQAFLQKLHESRVMGEIFSIWDRDPASFQEVGNSMC